MYMVRSQHPASRSLSFTMIKPWKQINLGTACTALYVHGSFFFNRFLFCSIIFKLVILAKCDKHRGMTFCLCGGDLLKCIFITCVRHSFIKLHCMSCLLQWSSSSVRLLFTITWSFACPIFCRCTVSWFSFLLTLQLLATTSWPVWTHVCMQVRGEEGKRTCWRSSKHRGRISIPRGIDGANVAATCATRSFDAPCDTQGHTLLNTGCAKKMAHRSHPLLWTVEGDWVLSGHVHPCFMSILCCW